MLIKLVAADLTKLVAWGRVVVRELHGWNAQGTDLYIQLHQKLVLTAGDVPAYKSLLAQSANGFFYSFGSQGVELSDLIVGISTTETTYTAVGAAGGIDLTLDVDTQFLCDGTETIVGDLTTGVNSLQVWSEATGLAAPQRLLRIDIKNNQGVDVLYNLIYAVDSVQPTSLITSFNPLPVSVTTTNAYGDGNSGFRPFQQDANHTQHNGCTINVSSTVVAGQVYGGTAPNIRALYKPI